ncbi:hypothetical protein AIOL_004562 [Candidatus Rhodobacter oscarellae]|uniref:DUF1800 domain-containing protein n=1 Tax=Candidatus Rhodobacter oscarellae TaxID=1675527 RepID=A0A0J9E9W2_9RHOB|nr:DUF1800 domain-containing protein [Candidatus Rhodobacter lobularis]KMW59580.1 hypothetical protein AIOL_004562 [Candidatus Rhodobacter lobularis]
MLFDWPISTQTYATIRFGLGYPSAGEPRDAAEILDRLAGPDAMAEAHPFLPEAEARTLARAVLLARRVKRKTKDGAALATARKEIRAAQANVLLADLARAVETSDPFRERLQSFWLNHFAARAKMNILRPMASSYAGEAIRPHVASRFADLLKAAVTHPFMLVYLDQPESIGPNSVFGARKGRGLNENLAREVIELHTLGVGADYSQADVRQFAELLTGLDYDPRRGLRFLPSRAEPGPETVLGTEYGADPARVEHIHAALEDIALHPATGPHLCRKLAAHFVADAPDAGLVAHMAAAYRSSGGHLMEVYAAMLEHPAAWAGFGGKVKRPMELVISSLRAVGVRAADLERLGPGQVRKRIELALRRMGQAYGQVPSPEGWPDNAEAWVHPHGVAGRIGWALGLARHIPGGAPDPREFVHNALGDAASERLVWAAGAAENRALGVALVLGSAEFNRR